MRGVQVEGEGMGQQGGSVGVGGGEGSSVMAITLGDAFTREERSGIISR